MTSARGALGCALATVIALLAIPAAAADFPVTPGDKIVGQMQTYVVQQGDNLADIARKFDIGYTEMIAANPGIAPWTPPVGQTLQIPSLYILPDAPRQGIVINLGARRLYYFPRNGEMQTYPVGIGAIGFNTPQSTTTVVRKEPNPVWIPPPSIRAEQPDLPDKIGPGPDDPLGAFALRLGWPNYLIHGTNKPDGVGRNVSHGCIHLYPEDIAKLFNSVAVGTPVRVVDQPAAAAWIAVGLYLEVHPSKDQADQIDTEQAMTPDPPAGLRDIVGAAAGDYAQAVDWNTVDLAGSQRTGLPIEVVTRPEGAPVASNAPPTQNAYAAPAASPIFNTLQPPPGMTPQAPPDLAGSAPSPDAPGYPPSQGGNDDAAAASQVPADQDVDDLQDLKAMRAAPAYGAVPAAGYNPYAPGSTGYSGPDDPDRPTGGSGYRQ